MEGALAKHGGDLRDALALSRWAPKREAQVAFRTL